MSRVLKPKLVGTLNDVKVKHESHSWAGKFVIRDKMQTWDVPRREEDHVDCGFPVEFSWQTSSSCSLLLIFSGSVCPLECGLLWIQDETLTKAPFCFMFVMYLSCNPANIIPYCWEGEPSHQLIFMTPASRGHQRAYKGETVLVTWREAIWKHKLVAYRLQTCVFYVHTHPHC